MNLGVGILEDIYKSTLIYSMTVILGKQGYRNVKKSF